LKTALGENCKKYFKISDFVQDAEFWFMWSLTGFFKSQSKEKYFLNDFQLNIIETIKKNEFLFP
jgi:hypothetical protein